MFSFDRRKPPVSAIGTGISMSHTIFIEIGENLFWPILMLPPPTQCGPTGYFSKSGASVSFVRDNKDMKTPILNRKWTVGDLIATAA